MNHYTGRKETCQGNLLYIRWGALRPTGSEGSKGKVDGASPRGLWPPAGGGLCSLRSGGGGSPNGLRVVDCRSATMIIKSALRDLLLCLQCCITKSQGPAGAYYKRFVIPPISGKSDCLEYHCDLPPRTPLRHSVALFPSRGRKTLRDLLLCLPCCVTKSQGPFL